MANRCFATIAVSATGEWVIVDAIAVDESGAIFVDPTGNTFVFEIIIHPTSDDTLASIRATAVTAIRTQAHDPSLAIVWLDDKGLL